jgi:hypothetical protein
MFCMVFSIRSEIFKSLSLKNSVIFGITSPLYVQIARFSFVSYLYFLSFCSFLLSCAYYFIAVFIACNLFCIFCIVAEVQQFPLEIRSLKHNNGQLGRCMLHVQFFK